VSDYLVGVDLSEAIITEAKRSRPNLYNQTRAGDVTDMFREMKPISLIIAADSYIYFGGEMILGTLSPFISSIRANILADLDPLFQSMEEGLEDGGFVAFTLENVGKETEEA
jgi:predicted TPR repeat methyltransferase